MTNVTYSLADITKDINIGYLLTPLVAVLEAMSIGKPFARKGHYKFDTSQELLPYGLANILGAFVQSGLPVTGTFSRTALNAASGVRTPAGGIVTGGIVLLALAFATPLFIYIPTASLSVVIILAVIDTMTFHKVWIFWKTNKIDLIPWFVTFVCSLVLGIAYGAFFGVAVSLLMLIYPSFRPKRIKDQKIVSVADGIVVFKLTTGLLFPAAEYVREKIIKFATNAAANVDDANVFGGLVVDCSTMANIDSSALQSIREVLEHLSKKNIHVVFCHLQKQSAGIFRRAHLKHFVAAADIDDAVKLIYEKRDQIPVVITDHSDAATVDRLSIKRQTKLNGGATIQSVGAKNKYKQVSQAGYQQQTIVTIDVSSGNQLACNDMELSDICVHF
jgi:sodium-independent sulfate anion transporter 11